MKTYMVGISGNFWVTLDIDAPDEKSAKEKAVDVVMQEDGYSFEIADVEVLEDDTEWEGEDEE